MEIIFLNLFSKKCGECNERRKIVHVEYIDGYNGYAMNYCEDCNRSRMQLNEFRDEAYEIYKEQKALEIREKKRTDYIKGEIERIEMEKKAKEYGIIYPNE